MAGTMKAWQFRAPGSLEKTLTLYSDVPKPDQSSLGPDDLLIKVIACGLNPADYKVLELGIIARAIVAFPKTVGMDLSGEVIAVGSAVTDIQVGAKIAGRVNPLGAAGALSSFLTIPRSRVAVLTNPETDVVLASGLATTALTAYQSIAPYVEAGRGDRIFINGGSGGVGSCCIQIAKLLGCHVTVTCSTGKVDMCRELGADDIIDYKKTASVTAELKKRDREYVLIVDNVGDSPTDLFSSSRSYLGKGKPYVFVGGHVSFSSATNMLLAILVPTVLGGVRGRFQSFITSDTPDDLKTVTEWFAEGKLKILEEARYGFEEAKTAMVRLKAGGATGKIIVTSE